MTKKQRREIAEIFYAAAEKIETYQKHYCCMAIDSVSSPNTNLARRIFIDLFKSDALNLSVHSHGVWFQELEEYSDDLVARNRRTLGLVMAAHLVLEGEIG